MLYDLIIFPIEFLVEIIFNFFTGHFSRFGIIGAIFGVSFVINILALPIYNVADALQEKERKIAKALEYRVKKIKKAFKGDEQFMMLQTYYRQNNYHPLYVLRSSLSILIEIPFFIAAYHFLSHCDALHEASFWIFKNLGKPDALFSIGFFQINVLPILMTLINFVSGAVYTKEAPAREKVQLYVVAFIFLALLYYSPSGLVIYWILNNLFSLFKNIVKKQQNPGKIFHIIMSVIVSLVGIVFCLKTHSLSKRGIIVLFVIAVIFIDKIISFAKRFAKNKIFTKEIDDKADFILLCTSGLGIALLAGFFLPVNVISSSPLEFSFLGKTSSPFTYIKDAFFVFAGFTVVWPIIIYKMFGKNVRVVEARLFALLFLIALANTFLFKFNYGEISATFMMNPEVFIKGMTLFNIAGPVVFVLLVVALFYFVEKFDLSSYLRIFLIAICVATLGLGLPKAAFINSQYKTELAKRNAKEKMELKPIYHFSKTGKNVVFIFLDRAVSSLFSEIIDGNTEFKESLKGFTYYPNTLSYGNYTFLGALSMLGGYDYIPDELNKRLDETIDFKRVESSLVMPAIFSDAGFEVTLADSFADKNDWPEGYKPKFVPEYKAYKVIGEFSEDYKKELNIEIQNDTDEIVNNELKKFVVINMVFPSMRKKIDKKFKNLDEVHRLYNDYLLGFIKNTSALYYLNKLTDFSGKKNQFIYMTNELNHEPYLLKEDHLTPVEKDNPFWQLPKTVEWLKRTYDDVAITSLKTLCTWFDYLKQNDVYDNTRIIIVSDHGFPLRTQNFSNFPEPRIPNAFNPIFMVKDFNANSDFGYDNSFMTNADSIFFAKKDLGISDINPYTNKKFVQRKDEGANVLFSLIVPSAKWCSSHNTYEYDEDKSFHVTSDIFNPANWTLLKDYKKEESSK